MANHAASTLINLLMCNRYQIRTNLHEIVRELAIQTTLDFEIPAEVFPYTVAPVLVINRDGQRTLEQMTFGMGKLRGEKSSRGHVLNNTRVESRDKWPWKKSFERYRCIVPMTSFREACYWGETAGSEVSFSAEDGGLLLAAGIFDFSKGQAGQSELAMSIVMRPALPFVMEHGHHRSPFFLRREGLDAWLQRSSRESAESIEVLREYADEPSLTVEIERQMAASWVKRQKANLSNRDEQIAEIEKLGPLGFR
jgi:putative SOS response-associated peptidase YedK